MGVEDTVWSESDDDALVLLRLATECGAMSTWLFDVDGTLIGSIRSDRLRPGVDDLLAALTGRGIRCVLWSAGGGQYARRKALEHGIEDSFIAFYPKGDRGGAARYGVAHLDADHRPDVFVDDCPEDLPIDARVVVVPQYLGSNPADRALHEVVDRLDDWVAPSDGRQLPGAGRAGVSGRATSCRR